MSVPLISEDEALSRIRECGQDMVLAALQWASELGEEADDVVVHHLLWTLTKLTGEVLPLFEDLRIKLKEYR